MSNKKYREDKTCLNCRHVVAAHFCPNCGQENIDTRKTFHHLFIHFFEDLTHYENAFWKTIKNLLFKPAALTKEYLSGKRLSYLAPVRLYIFISFITFFMIAFFTSTREEESNSKKIAVVNALIKDEQDSIKYLKTQKHDVKISSEELKIDKLLKEGKLKEIEADSLKAYIHKAKINKEINPNNFVNVGYTSVKQMDSIRKIKPNSISDFEYWFNKKVINVTKRNTNEEIIEKGLESGMHNFPKVLLIYMPLFAFFLWLFHDKKQYYYFDHGIFTLHYFSFLLLLILILFISQLICETFLNQTVANGIMSLLNFIGITWMFYYFFPAHHRFYGETRVVSFIKSIVLFFINIILILILLTLFFIYTLISIH